VLAHFPLARGVSEASNRGLHTSLIIRTSFADPDPFRSVSFPDPDPFPSVLASRIVSYSNENNKILTGRENLTMKAFWLGPGGTTDRENQVKMYEKYHFRYIFSFKQKDLYPHPAVFFSVSVFVCISSH
jgi:hypothetical protein